MANSDADRPIRVSTKCLFFLSLYFTDTTDIPNHIKPPTNSRNPIKNNAAENPLTVLGLMPKAENRVGELHSLYLKTFANTNVKIPTANKQPMIIAISAIFVFNLIIFGVSRNFILHTHIYLPTLILYHLAIKRVALRAQNFNHFATHGQ
jgi:hypothetical protein